MWFLVLMGILAFSVGALGYVVFFRTVSVAKAEEQRHFDLVFEETVAPIEVEPDTREENQIKSQLPQVAIIVDDMGYHPEVGRKLLELPFKLTFSFLANAPFTRDLEQKAHAKKRTIMLHLPLEPRNKEWELGPDGLFLGELSLQRKLFEKNLMAVPHATGVNNHMGSLYSEDEQHMRELLKIIADKKLFYVDSFTSAGSVGVRLAREIGVKVARRHVFLDNIQTTESVCDQLEKLTHLAEKKGWAIGIGHPFQATYLGLSQCGHQLFENVQLVGVDKLVR